MASKRKTLVNTDSNGTTKAIGGKFYTKSDVAWAAAHYHANIPKYNVKDVVFWGNGDTFKLISKASSVEEGWMKSTKAMEIPFSGCVIQVTTQQGEHVAEALTFVPGVKIEEIEDEAGNITGRKIVRGYARE